MQGGFVFQVWAMQNGPRVSAFNVDKKGRLLAISRPEDIILGGSVGNDQGAGPTSSISAAAFFVATDGHVKVGTLLDCSC